MVRHAHGDVLKTGQSLVVIGGTPGEQIVFRSLIQNLIDPTIKIILIAQRSAAGVSGQSVKRVLHRWSFAQRSVFQTILFIEGYVVRGVELPGKQAPRIDGVNDHTGSQGRVGNLFQLVPRALVAWTGVQKET